MYRVDIITDQTERDGRPVTHTFIAGRDQVDSLTIALNAGLDYVSITDKHGTLHHVRTMDIHAVSSKVAR